MKKLENKNLEIIESFDELKLNDNIYQGIFSYGYNEPSTVQKYAIKPILDRKDCIINEKSGTGKTGAFVIGSLGIIEENYSGC
jgi:ATP-dependent RNA helicase